MIQLRVTLPALPVASGNVVGRIRTRFQHEAGTLILDAIRSLLGMSSIYTLSAEYSRKKQKLSKFRRVGGKASDQPLILSAAGIYDALTIIPEGDGFIVQVDDSKGTSDKGFDFAEHWEEITDYLGKGLDLVEDQLDELLASIIEDEMML